MLELRRCKHLEGTRPPERKEFQRGPLIDGFIQENKRFLPGRLSFSSRRRTIDEIRFVLDGAPDPEAFHERARVLGNLLEMKGRIGKGRERYGAERLLWKCKRTHSDPENKYDRDDMESAQKYLDVLCSAANTFEQRKTVEFLDMLNAEQFDLLPIGGGQDPLDKIARLLKTDRVLYLAQLAAGAEWERHYTSRLGIGWTYQDTAWIIHNLGLLMAQLESDCVCSNGGKCPQGAIKKEDIPALNIRLSQKDPFNYLTWTWNHIEFMAHGKDGSYRVETSVKENERLALKPASYRMELCVGPKPDLEEREKPGKVKKILIAGAAAAVAWGIAYVCGYPSPLRLLDGSQRQELMQIYDRECGGECFSDAQETQLGQLDTECKEPYSQNLGNLGDTELDPRVVQKRAMLLCAEAIYRERH